MHTKTLEYAYLYADGHAVLVYEKRDKDAGRIRFVEIIESYIPMRACRFTGRICWRGYDATFDLCKKAVTVRAEAPDVKHGSDNTRAKGIAVGNLTLEFKNGARLYQYQMPDLISGPYTHQPDVAESFDASVTTWGTYPVGNILRKPSPAVQAAA